MSGHDLMSEELPAEELLARVARRDVAAVSELYDRYAPRVYGLMAYILPSRDAAEEILREVFVRLWSESSRLSQEGASVPAWLVVSAREAAVGRLRAERKNALNAGHKIPSVNAAAGSNAGPRKSKPSTLLAAAGKTPDKKSETMKPRGSDGARVPAMGPVPSAWLPHPKEITLIDDRLVLLTKVISQLPKPQRQALEFAVFRGFSESEIAADLGEPLGKVRTSLRAALTFVKHRRRAVCGTWAANI